MQRRARFWKRFTLGLAIVLIAGFAVRTWVVGPLIVALIEARIESKVSIRGWWFDGNSSGVIGLVLHEGMTADSPVRASAERVATDISLLGLLRGRLSPGKVVLKQLRVMLKLDRRGQLVMPLILHSAHSSSGKLPVVVVQDAGVTIQQEGRAPMVITRIGAKLEPDAGEAKLTVRSVDPHWGPFKAHGRFDKTFQSGQIGMESLAGVTIDDAKARRIPFVPPEVWTNVVPNGAVDVRLTVRLAPGPKVAVKTVVGLRHTSAKSTALDLTATDTSGEVVVDGAFVQLNHIAGQTLGGRLEANGTLDFANGPPQFDVALGLDGISIDEAPTAWQLEQADIDGKLFGDVRLKAVLRPRGIDLSGSSGEAEVREATVQGIPIKALRLAMHARGNALEFETNRPGLIRSAETIRRALTTPNVPFLPLEHGHMLVSLATTRAVGELVAAQANGGDLSQAQAPAQPAKSADPPTHHGGIHLPRSVTTQIELEDVDLAELLARAQAVLDEPRPLPIAGQFSLKATATIPLGKLRDVKDYEFHGTLSLTAASLFGVDIGHLSARLDLAGGIFELSDLRGQLVELADGCPDKRPHALPAAIAAAGPLPAGGFRGRLRAEVSPVGALSAALEGNQLPLGELVAPLFPRPTPVTGVISLNSTAHADLRQAADPKSWTARGTAQSLRLAYHDKELDSLAFGFALEGGHLDLSNVKAHLKGEPLALDGGIDLSPPYAFDARVNVSAWDLETLLALVPGAPPALALSGTVTAKSEARGTLVPLSLATTGDGRLGRIQAGQVRLGDIPFHWSCGRDELAITGVEARIFGGRFLAEARVPLSASGTTRGSASISGIDTAKLAAALPARGLDMTGIAAGRLEFAVPHDVTRLEASARLSAPDFTVHGLRAEHLLASVSAHNQAVHYELTAATLGGEFKFAGSYPLDVPADKAVASARFHAERLSLAELWKELHVTGAAGNLLGRGAFDATLNAARTSTGEGIWASGAAEFRELSWGPHLPLGYLRGDVAVTPTTWKIEPLSGELLSGPTSGFISGTNPTGGARKMGFEVRVDHADLRHTLAFLPDIARHVTGHGTLLMSGQFDESVRMNAELFVTQARFAGFPLNELRAPAELVLTPSTGTGILHVRHWNARLAGGHARGNAVLRVGEDRSFHADLRLASIDLEAIARLESNERQPASGKISGRITVSGPDPTHARTYRGRVELRLDDASFVSVPVFRELDRFVGASRGGLFEKGELNASIANGQLGIEMLALEGRLAQVHATGTVGFNGQLNLEVLVNTNQVIAQSGEALLGAIPGLRRVIRRREEARLQFSNYLSNRLLKLRVGGTLKNPSISADPAIVVADSAVGFFAGVLELPLGILK